MKHNALIILLFCTAISCTNSQQPHTVFEEWKGTNIQEVNSLALESMADDITSLKSIINDTEIVCLGESRHDISEQFKLKNRFVKYMVETLGFRAFALESSFPYAKKLNDYLISGEGDLDQIMSEMPGWFIWDTEELKALFVWLKAFNAKADDKVVFYGFDIVAPNNGYEQIFDYLQRVDNAYYTSIEELDFGRELINDNHWPTTLQQFANMPQARKTAISQNAKELHQTIKSQEKNYIAKSSKKEYEWMLRLAYSAKAANEMFFAEDRIQMGLIRDEAMANNCSWIISQGQKTIIWAHNVHISEAEFSMSMFPNTKIKGMGSLLSDEFGDKMVSIGASFGTGEFENEDRSFEMPDENTIDGSLAKLGMDNLIVDLRKPAASEELRKWLMEENSIRGQEFEMHCVPIEAFDALFYTNKVSKVAYKAATQQRLNNE